MEKTVIELFAGVGGFRVGLNNVTLENNTTVENGNFNFVWANQWEPSTKTQHAFDCYRTRFGEQAPNSNMDISKVNKSEIPNHNLLCGGFPCQDYSVARSLSQEKGIEGKKGVLWWQIKEILEVKNPAFVLLENVDRLPKSPSKQRGRDFGIMLRCFAELDYTVEWRVINAAEYGLPQRRRRIYIFAYKNTTLFSQQIRQHTVDEIFNQYGIFARAFPIQNVQCKKNVDILNDYKNLLDVSDNFKYQFENSGLLLNGTIYTVKTLPILQAPITLGQIATNNVDNSFFLTQSQEAKFAYLRGSKKIPRVDANGHEYMYSEGAMSPYDDLTLPGRTMLTSEGTVNRSSHIIRDPQNNRLRFLTPIECERLNQFPDDWTNTGMPEKRRYFMMGNALVCGIISRLGVEIDNIMTNEP